MKREIQPAKVSYFFGAGWEEMWLFIKKFWGFNQEDIKKRAEKVETGKGIMSLSGAGRLLSCFSLILFGTLFFILISAAVSIVLGVAFLAVYVLIFVIWSVDRLYLIRKGMSKL